MPTSKTCLKSHTPAKELVNVSSFPSPSINLIPNIPPLLPQRRFGSEIAGKCFFEMSQSVGSRVCAFSISNSVHLDWRKLVLGDWTSPIVLLNHPDAVLHDLWTIWAAH